MADSPTDDDPLVANPTYLGNIRYFFTEDDINHMAAKKVDLASYDGVKTNAVDIYGQTSSGAMPMSDPPPAPQRLKWSANRNQTFLNWIVNGYPMGTATAQAPQLKSMASLAASTDRVRKDINDLTAPEIAALKAAFSGIMALDPSDPNSYFAIAGTHWLPSITNNPNSHCLHHENRYNPWHRVYLKIFEDALRSVPGCGDVTLPYWDITTPVPDLLYEPPFDKYTLQGSIGAPYDPNYVTERYDAATVNDNIQNVYPVPPLIDTALKQAVWENFNYNIWSAHDNGHVSCGITMQDQNVAAFDPIFWFFHCNWDRLWLQWQEIVGATTLATFTSTCSGPTIWLTMAPFNALNPFGKTADQTISYPGIAYAAPQKGAATMELETKVGSIAAVKSFSIAPSTPVSVRVKEIDRLNIPGTFVVHLMADGESIARQAFFQPTNPIECPNCRENGLVNIDFRLDQEQILGRKLSVAIEVPAHRDIGAGFPLSRAGSPTVNARLLLEES